MILALLLSAGICIAGQSVDVFASEPANQEEETGQNDKALQMGYIDLSDNVIQEGGFPEKPAGSGRQKSRSATSNRQQAQAALVNAWENFKDSCDLLPYGITITEMKSIYSEALNTHPEYFYVAGQYSYSYNPSNNIVIELTITYAVDKDTAMDQKSAYDRVVAKVKSNADDSWSDMEKALYVNDYLARNCEYDTSLEKFTAYDVLVRRTAVCQGYALAFLDLARELGVSCEVVTSDSVNHAWNMVNIGGNYYHIDVTWNDPVADLLGRARHIFFLKSTSYFKSSTGGKSHFNANDWVISGSLTDAAASDTSYDDYFWDNVNIGFDYVNGSWYGFNGSDSICKYSCNGKQFSDVGSVIAINDKWDVIGQAGSIWRDSYVGTGFLDGKYYYSGSKAIYELNLNTGANKKVFELTSVQQNTGRIFGINVTPSGIFQYVFSASPDGSVPKTIYTIDELSVEEKVNTYSIHFDGNEADGNMAAMTSLKSGEAYSLTANTFSRKGRTFKGWNTKSDGTGRIYADKGKITYWAAAEGEVLTLYAQWSECNHAETRIDGQKEATCTQEGYTGDSYCKYCNVKTAAGKVIPKRPHTPVVDKAVAATCTTEGKTEGSHCSVCNAVITEQKTVPALDHDWDKEYTIDRPATKDEEGEKSIHCKRCTERINIEALPKIEEGHEHEPTIRAAVEATCTTDGKTEGVYCATCGEILKKQEIIPAGHKEVIDAGKAATCVKTGLTEGKHCSVCNQIIVKQRSIPATGRHSFGAWKTTVNPKVGVAGKKIRVCSVCQKTEEQTVPALEKKVVKVSSIKISTPLSYQIAEGRQVALKASVNPGNASNKGVIWKSSNTKVAKVDQKGRVTVLKKSGGKKAVITVTAKDGSGVKKSVTIKSMKGAVKSISISGKNKVKAGKAVSLKAKVKAAKGANKKVIWKSSNTKAATVSASGKIVTKRNAKGKSIKITAMAADGSGKKKSFTIKIQ